MFETEDASFVILSDSEGEIQFTTNEEFRGNKVIYAKLRMDSQFEHYYAFALRTEPLEILHLNEITDLCGELTLDWSYLEVAEPESMLIFRQPMNVPIVLDDCEIQSPSLFGYQLVAEIEDITVSSWSSPDSTQGQERCYVSIMRFSDGSYSNASNVRCVTIDTTVEDCLNWNYNLVSNPSYGLIEVEGNNEGLPCLYELYNLQGNVVHSGSSSGASIQIPVSLTGVYHLRVSCAGQPWQIIQNIVVIV